MASGGKVPTEGGRVRGIRDAVEQELVWGPAPGEKRTFVLRAGEEVLATIRWPSVWRSAAEATVAEGSWRIEREGIWMPRHLVRTSPTNETVATYTVGLWAGGTLRSAAGTGTYWWEGDRLLGRTFAWRAADDRRPVRFRPGGWFRAPTATIEFPAPDAAGADLPLLVAFGWYLRVIGLRAVVAHAGVLP